MGARPDGGQYRSRMTTAKRAKTVVITNAIENRRHFILVIIAVLEKGLIAAHLQKAPSILRVKINVIVSLLGRWTLSPLIQTHSILRVKVMS